MLGLLKCVGISQCKPVSTPLSTSAKLSLVNSDPMVDVTKCRQLVSALQYLTLTRPDIYFLVNKVC